MKITEVIKLAIKGLIAFPKCATIKICQLTKIALLGTKASVSHLFGIAKHAVGQTEGFSSLGVSTYATNTIGTLKNTDILLVIKKLRNDLEHLNLDGLAKDLGITKEGVMNLIWLLGGVRNTNNGSEIYSLETISLVKSALLKERILKQITFRLDSRSFLTKKKLRPTNKRWRVNGYGMKIMGERFAESVIGVSV